MYHNCYEIYTKTFVVTPHERQSIISINSSHKLFLCDVTTEVQVKQTYNKCAYRPPTKHKFDEVDSRVIKNFYSQPIFFDIKALGQLMISTTIAVTTD